MKRNGIWRVAFLLVLAFASIQTLSAQTTINYSIGEILAAGPAGLVMADGTVAHAEIITLGSGNPSVPEHGQYNITSFGGELNGISDNNITTGTVNDQARTLAGYNNSKTVGQFTRFGAPPPSIDNGINGAKFGNAVGFRVWFSAPIDVKQFLMVDIDGQDDNAEWASVFGYNGTTQVQPVSVVTGSSITNSNRTVNNNWPALVASKIPGAAPFTTMQFPRVTSSPNTAGDPDDFRTQALFNFGTPVDNLFFLFGISGDRTGVSGMQNIGVSPIPITSFTTPVVLKNFSGRSTGCTASLLNWSINDAINFNHFEIERSNSGGKFATVGTIEYNSPISNYSFTDNNLLNGIYQYRLKMVDADGRFTYSNIIVIKLTCNGSPVILYPNPTTDNINISGLRGGELIQVIGANGQFMIQKKAVQAQEKIDVRNFADGVYTVVVLNGDERILITKIIKSVN